MTCWFPVVCMDDLKSSVLLLKAPNKLKDYLYLYLLGNQTRKSKFLLYLCIGLLDNVIP
jgi:hypothetical protein